MSTVDRKDSEELLRAIVSLESMEEARAFLRDLLTENELKEFAQRWRVARMLYSGVSYTTIENETGLSSTTIARISKWLHHGKGGYLRLLRRFS